MITSRSQRWRNRRSLFIPANTTVRQGDYAVDVIDCYKAAKPFILANHYSGSMPATRCSVGLFKTGRGGRQELVGVASFSVPMNNAAIPKYTGLAHYNQGAELGRFVLLDDVPGNGETFFLARAFRALRKEKPEIISILSYADPMIRRGPDGHIIAPGHIGGAYCAASAVYRGRSKPRMELFTPDGQIFSERALSKIRKHETGIGYAIDELVRRGAPRPTGNPNVWLQSLISSGFFKKRKHHGNHVYTFPLTRAARLAGKNLPELSYPVLDRNPIADDVTALPLLQAA